MFLISLLLVLVVLLSCLSLVLPLSYHTATIITTEVVQTSGSVELVRALRLRCGEDPTSSSAVEPLSLSHSPYLSIDYVLPRIIRCDTDQRLLAKDSGEAFFVDGKMPTTVRSLAGRAKHIYVRVYVCVCICLYIYIYILCRYVCVCVYIYIYIYIL